MITLQQLKKRPGSTKRRKVVGRGLGSGHGTYSTRGGKGQTARTGHSKMPVAFEGGRQPLVRQLPKSRGFTAITAKATAVKLDRLNALPDNTIVTIPVLQLHGIIPASAKRAKILVGSIKKKLEIRVPISAAAKAAVEAAGGSARS
jgi:large subunit ribosomal protein L15